MNIKIIAETDESKCIYCGRKFQTEDLVDSICSGCFEDLPLEQLAKLLSVSFSHTLILNLFEKHGYSMKEIHENFDINYNTVRTVINRYKKDKKGYYTFEQLKTLFNNSMKYIEIEILN
ncbi:MAG: hypothetical protein HeimC3_28450 [Candidatus Heimdallarchaeota archaeon LC_3]|nr:MAG: hypothetical protein HeimC3_28450 [Candidatus Heimdallarchaeota archaeon LC_3]